jgi:hypothetical protein
MFANYFYLDQIKNKQVSASITQNLVHYLFPFFIEQGKKVDKEIKNCFDRFCEALPKGINLYEFKSQVHQTIVSYTAKQYESLACNNISSKFEKRIIVYFLGLFSKSCHNLFCSDSLTVTQKKSLTHHFYQKKSSPSTSK